MNPCPCGYLGSKIKSCRCTPDQVSRYQGKLSGPLLDRIDLHVEVAALPSNELLRSPAGETSAQIRQRVTEARDRALKRQGKLNQALGAQDLAEHAALIDTTRQFLETAAARLGWSARSTHRTLKLARSVADLADSGTIELTHVAEAMQYRRTLREHA